MSSHKKSVAVVEYDKVFTYDHLFQAFKHCSVVNDSVRL